MINNLKKTERFLLTVVICLISCAIIYHFLAEPTLKRIKSLQKEIVIRERVLLKSRKILLQQDIIKEQYASIIKGVRIAVSKEEEIAKFLKEINKLSQKAKIKIDDIKPRESRVLEQFNKSVVDIEFEAQQTTLAAFLYELAMSPIGIRIEQLRITARHDQKKILTCNAMISRILVDENKS